MNEPASWKARKKLVGAVKSHFADNSIRRGLVSLETKYEMVRNVVALAAPGVITPSPKYLTIAITARCNLRCQGCLYGRGYMHGEELTTEEVILAIRDAAAAGMSTVRLYGGEPLLHPGLPDMIKECRVQGITPFVSTNGILLGNRLEPMVTAGLRILSFGYYGYGPPYDSYVGVRGAWDRFESGIADARRRYKNAIDMHISFVLNTRTCSLEELEHAWRFATQHELKLHIDLIHYSLPYFTEGPDRELRFKPSDADRIVRFANRLEELQHDRPDLYTEPVASIRSIQDWLLKGPNMKVPCDAYNLIWIGADGSVRLCYAAFPLGNLHETSLRQILFGQEHRTACKDALALKCPNCHCGRDHRISKHFPSLLRYSFRPRIPLATPDEARDGFFTPSEGREQCLIQISGQQGHGHDRPSHR